MRTQADILAEYKEKYRIAVEYEQHVRDSAFISDTEFIGNIEVWALTPKLFTLLTLSQNALVTDNVPLTEASVLTFLWTIKKDQSGSPNEFFERTLQSADIEVIMNDIHDYFDRAFADIFGSSDSGKNTVPYFSSLAVVVDRLASEYGWDEEKIINIPYKRLMQYMRLLEKKNNPKTILINGSDKVKSEMLRALRENK